MNKKIKTVVKKSKLAYKAIKDQDIEAYGGLLLEGKHCNFNFIEAIIYSLAGIGLVMAIISIAKVLW